MEFEMNKNSSISLLFLFAFFFSCGPKAEIPVSRINDAKIIFAIGDVKVKSNNAWTGAKEEMKLTEKDEITTGTGARISPPARHYGGSSADRGAGQCCGRRGA